ncbi:hypothetical protein D041_0413A, partial [Vibrio parahaemolyticus EKP-008]
MSLLLIISDSAIENFSCTSFGAYSSTQPSSSCAKAFARS